MLKFLSHSSWRPPEMSGYSNITCVKFFWLRCIIPGDSFITLHFWLLVSWNIPELALWNFICMLMGVYIFILPIFVKIRHFVGKDTGLSIKVLKFDKLWYCDNITRCLKKVFSLKCSFPLTFWSPLWICCIKTLRLVMQESR